MITTLAASVITSIAGASGAAFMTGSPYVVPNDSQITLEFVSQDAGAKGSLYFLGTESNNVFSPAPNSDSNNLGAFIFSNHGTTAGAGFSLGIFQANSIIHFAYLITSGVGILPTGTLTRTDDVNDLVLIGLESMADRGDATVTRLHLEDIKNPSHSDYDYNDLRVDIIAQPVPAPGALTLATFGLLFAIPRRIRLRRAAG